MEYYAIKHISSNQVRRLEEAKKQLLTQTQLNNHTMIPPNRSSMMKKSQLVQQVVPEELIPSFQGSVRCIGHSFDIGY